MADQEQLDALLSSLVAAGRPSSMSLPRPQGLRNFTELAQWLAGPSRAPAGEDLTVPGPAGPVPIRVYRPERPAGSPRYRSPRSAAVFCHGGGWVLGGLDSHDTLCRELAAQAGAVLVAVDYRLAPEHPYPAGLEMLARDDGGVAVTLQVLAYPALDPAMDTASYKQNADDPFLSRSEMETYWSYYLGDRTPDRLAAPALAPGLAGLPPAYLMVAGRDVLRDEGAAYAERLAAAGVPVRLRRFDDMVHGFLLCTAWLDAARSGVAELAAVLRDGLDPAAGGT
jgi:acetyl esterase